MPDNTEPTIAKLLQDSDRADAIRWLEEIIGKAAKFILVCASPNPDGGLDLSARQMGFQYIYEIDGFLEWFKGFDWTDDENEDEPS